MSRTSFNYSKYSFYILCFFLIGFIFVQFYWQKFIRIHCLPSEIIDPIRLKYSFYDHFQYRTIRTCQNDQSKLILTIAILSSFERLLIYLPSIINTWALLTTNEIEIIIFLEEKSLIIAEEFIKKLFFQLNYNQQIKACLFIVQLKHVENAYPPQKKSFYAMKFLYLFYQSRTLWLLRLDDNAYVNIEKLVRWLKSIDYQKLLYIGQSGSGRRNESTIHFPIGEYFCMGGSGVILSQRTLIELGPWLDYCLNNEILTKHEDVELGRCILKHVNISCTNAYDLKNLFYHHYGPRYLFGYDFTSTILSQALIIHPIKDENTFKQIFGFYLREKQYVQRNISLKNKTNNINYVTFLSKIEFNLARDIHYQVIDARSRSYIKQIVRLYMEKLRINWYKNSSKWILTHGYFIFGYHRIIPLYGLESIIEIQLNVHTNVISSPIEFSSIRKRFHIRQLFSSNQYKFNYREIELNKNIQQLNLIVVSCNKDKALKRFINNFQYEILNNSFRYQYFTLTILYFLQNNQTNNKIIDFINPLTVRYVSKIRLSIINQTNITYNRGLGRQLASKLFTSNQILFFLDVDLEFTGQALDNTRRLMIHQLSISNCTVYFPIIFSSYSSMFIINKSLIMDIHSKNGLFSIYGFGNVAVYKKDLDKIGGWEVNNKDWGNEDVDLFQRFSHPSAECYVFRAVEPGLRHYYHKKMCNEIINIERQKICHDADINLLGSQADMVDYLIDNKIIKY